MSDKDLDKLFKTKLEELHTSPSPQAWDQISDGIEGKSRGMIWWRIAAAVLLLISIVGIVQWNLPETAAPLATQDAPATTPEQEKTNSASEQPAQGMVEEQPTETLALADSPNTTPIETEKNTLEAEDEGKDVAPATTGKEQAPVLIQENNRIDNSTSVAVAEEPAETAEIEANLPTEEDMAAATTVAAVQGSTRSFSIDEFSNAQRSEVTEEQVTEQKDEKGLKKIWNLLRQVKEPENGIGDLREMKNELFAFGKSKKESDKQ